MPTLTPRAQQRGQNEKRREMRRVGAEHDVLGVEQPSEQTVGGRGGLDGRVNVNVVVLVSRVALPGAQPPSQSPRARGTLMASAAEDAPERRE
eukprot:scaffold4899_cov135-Isochrysis_galbana.AAC.2